MTVRGLVLSVARLIGLLLAVASVRAQTSRADCEQALKLAPDNAEALANRGNLRQAQGDLDGALADFNRALSRAPQNQRELAALCRRSLARGASARPETTLSQAQLRQPAGR